MLKEDLLEVSVTAGAPGRSTIRENEAFLQAKLESAGGGKRRISFVFREDKGPREEKKKIEALRQDEKINSLTEKIKGKLVTIESIEEG